MQIKIPFNSWSRKRLREGVKTCTSRTKILGKKGDLFKVDGTTYVITGVNEYLVNTIIQDLYKEEGAKDSAEMERALKGVQRTKQLPSTLVVHFFRKVEAT